VACVEVYNEDILGGKRTNYPRVHVPVYATVRVGVVYVYAYGYVHVVEARSGIPCRFLEDVRHLLYGVGRGLG